MQQRVCLHGFLAAAAADVDVSDFCWLFYDQAVEEFFYIGFFFHVKIYLIKHMLS